MPLDIRKVVSDWIRDVGPAEATRQVNKLVGRKYSMSAIHKWKDRIAWPPGWVIQHVVDIQQKEAEDWDHQLPWEGERLRICMPIYRYISPRTFKSVFILRKRHGDKIGLDVEMGSSPELARNRLATRFLDSDADWMMMMDDDMVPPVGHPGQLYKWGARFNANFMKFDVVSRLISHKQMLVSALCFDKYGQGVPMYAEGRNDEKEAERARNGPYDTIKATDWFGGGCFVCHRKVLESILRQVPGVASTQEGRPHGFFTPLDHGVGEDVSFCRRAATAGIQPYVDMGCIAGHTGSYTFFNKKII